MATATHISRARDMFTAPKLKYTDVVWAREADNHSKCSEPESIPDLEEVKPEKKVWSCADLEHIPSELANHPIYERLKEWLEDKEECISPVAITKSYAIDSNGIPGSRRWICQLTSIENLNLWGTTSINIFPITDETSVPVGWDVAIGGQRIFSPKFAIVSTKCYVQPEARYMIEIPFISVKKLRVSVSPL